ncbi:MAG TPA: SRPBCC family protein [Gemmatimonadaceae bacterium]
MTIDADGSVRHSVTVAAPPRRAFDVFTADFDSWWPRTHHIGSSPMTKAIIEGRAGGRCYSQQEDGTECPWGRVLVWEPPHRLIIAWQITATWGFEPDLARASEVEVRFIDAGDGRTRVELEHRHFERMGPDGTTMRTAVSAPGGWGTLMGLFAARVAGADQGVAAS